jgi:hypothetical protein
MVRSSRSQGDSYSATERKSRPRVSRCPFSEGVAVVRCIGRRLAIPKRTLAIQDGDFLRAAVAIFAGPQQCSLDDRRGLGLAQP